MSSLRFDVSRIGRATVGAMVAAIAIIAVPGDAAAKRRQHLAHHRRMHVSVQIAQAAAPLTVTLGPMRYYGGPKSPMWREVR